MVDKAESGRITEKCSNNFSRVYFQSYEKTVQELLWRQPQLSLFQCVLVLYYRTKQF